MQFNSQFIKGVIIPNDCEVVFVADFFSEDLIGGAELTSDALINSSPLKVFKVHSKDVSIATLQSGINKFWIFGNFSLIDFSLLSTILRNLKYSILEYDYKFCVYRSPEKHKATTGSDCNCKNNNHGKLISEFYKNARSLWWMSQAQQERYQNAFPELKDTSQSVLSSVFDENFWTTLESINSKISNRSGWIVLGSDSWIKGADDAEQWCKQNNLQYEVVKGLSPHAFLEKLSQSTGLVYLPKGGDTCPRMVIEAKLLGCQLHINENVEHAKEEWFKTKNLSEIKKYLYNSREFFWNSIKKSISWKPTISGYTTTKDCISQEYPWEKTIESMLGFCDEVVVVDGGSTDGTWERLQELASQSPKLKISQIIRDWNSKRFAVFDGQQKAEARKLCTKQFCWQMDADETVPENDWAKIKGICERFPSDADLVCLPVVEYWGSKEKVRVDVTPWKWRLSRNKHNITHGIPKEMRRYDSNGELYASQGTDGCDYIDSKTGNLIPNANFYTVEVHNLRLKALQGDVDSLNKYTAWFASAVNSLPSVRHFSWIDIKRKIKTYRGFWQRHWESLYDIKSEDTAQNNMFFDAPWSEVTDEMIDELAEKLATNTGGHIFHSKIDWTRPTPWMVAKE